MNSSKRDLVVALLIITLTASLVYFMWRSRHHDKTVKRVENISHQYVRDRNRLNQYERPLPRNIPFVTPVDTNNTFQWHDIGTVESVSTTDDKLFPIQQRLDPSNPEYYEYRIVIDRLNSVFLYSNTIPALQNRTHNNRLRHGDTFMIPTYSTVGPFRFNQTAGEMLVPLI